MFYAKKTIFKTEEDDQSSHLLPQFQSFVLNL
ncbi:MAG: hypothetical protein H6Q17_1608 [Bacteroidetes bacterium]|nr:hypothetical protein [Bacteroidota bacterium]